MADTELMHYGVLGMKWGVRRYQNADGSLTAEGRRRAKNEYKEDNRKAFELGKKASILNEAANYARKKEASARNEYDATHRRAIREVLEENYAKAEKEVEAHRQELIKKYGTVAVSDIKRDKDGRIHERVATGKDWAASVGLTAVSLAAAYATNAPIAVAFKPYSAKGEGKKLYKHLNRHLQLNDKRP